MGSFHKRRIIFYIYYYQRLSAIYCTAKCNVKGVLPTLFISPVVLLVHFTVYPSATLSEPKNSSIHFKTSLKLSNVIAMRRHWGEDEDTGIGFPASGISVRYRFRFEKSYKQKTQGKVQHLKNNNFSYCFAYNFFRNIPEATSTYLESVWNAAFYNIA
jgi:hypothetical protein